MGLESLDIAKKHEFRFIKMLMRNPTGYWNSKSVGNKNHKIFSSPLSFSLHISSLTKKNFETGLFKNRRDYFSYSVGCMG